MEKEKRIRVTDTRTFILRARQVHGDRYIYDKVTYTKSVEEVTITCRLHGDYVQRARAHLQKQGCPKCAVEERISL